MTKFEYIERLKRLRQDMKEVAMSPSKRMEFVAMLDNLHLNYTAEYGKSLTDADEETILRLIRECATIVSRHKLEEFIEEYKISPTFATVIRWKADVLKNIYISNNATTYVELQEELAIIKGNAIIEWEIRGAVYDELSIDEHTLCTQRELAEATIGYCYATSGRYNKSDFGAEVYIPEVLDVVNNIRAFELVTKSIPDVVDGNRKLPVIAHKEILNRKNEIIALVEIANRVEYYLLKLSADKKTVLKTYAIPRVKELETVSRYRVLPEVVFV